MVCLMFSAFRTVRPAASLGRLTASGLSSALLMLAATATLPALAQADLRSSFPGRRVGGATRGECAARLIVHLVPPNSVLAPGSAGIGLLMGPSPAPRPLRVDLRPLGRAGTPDRSVTPLLERTLPAAPAGVTLLSLAAVQSPAVWESAYACADAASATAAPAADPLSFVESSAPPALSLLVRDSGAEDQRFQAALRELRRSCGSSVATADLAKSFELGDLLNTDWPARLPVSCP